MNVDTSTTFAANDQIARPARVAIESSTLRLLLYLAQMLLDLAAIVAGFLIANILRHGEYLRSEDVKVALIAAPIYVFVAFYLRAYSSQALRQYGQAARRAVIALLITLGMLLLLAFGDRQSEEISRTVFLSGAVLGGILLVAARYPIAWLVRHRIARNFMRWIIIVDETPAEATALFDRVDATALGLRPDLHDPISLHNFSCIVAGYDRVVVSCPPERREAWSLYLQAVGCTGELLVPELAGIVPSNYGAGAPGIRVSSGPLDLRNRVLKRLLDLGITVPMLILFAPLLAAIAVAIKLDTPGPVLFRQQRIGRENRLFNVMKFRSMKHERTDHSGSRSASRDDDRITRVGRFIRATSLDELPQLFNILQGDMALVGPRPHALGSRAGDALFWHVDHRYWLRHSTKPGLTGLAQVRGFRGATDRREDLHNRLHSDLEYLSNWSVFRDLSILIRTAGVIVHKKAY